MNTLSRKLHRYAPLLAAVLLVGMMPASFAAAKASSTASAPAAPAAPGTPAAADAAAPPAPAPDEPTITSPQHGHWHHSGKHVNVNVDSDDNSLFNFGDVTLAAGDHADNVVSIFGDSISAGEVAQSVVSILGDSRVTGLVGDSVVVVLGDLYLDSKVQHDVVTVLGDVTLGPHANIEGDFVTVGGTVHRDPAAQVHGSVQQKSFDAPFTKFRPWIEHCFKFGRPLAFVSGISWAWTLAFVALALYLFAALLFAPAVEHCIQVLEKYPGQSLLTMILTIIATPIVFVILCITVVGIIAVPFLGIALFLAKFFGKLVMLAWIGRRVLRSQQSATPMHTVSAVLVGGLLVMLMYCVPAIGIILYYLLGLLGLGVVIYALLLQIQGRRPAPGMSAFAHSEPAAAAAAAAAGAPAASAASAASESPAATAAAPPAGAGVKPSRVSGEAAVALPRAGFWIRMLALLLDSILVGVVMHLISASSDVFLIVLAAYGVVMWRLRGSTVGGIIFNLAVVKHDGREMDWGTATVRALSAFLSLFALGLGFIWIAIDSENRSWHDKIAGTVVVRVP
jgi:uncharacterized RDD family membrane protein YckC